MRACGAITTGYAMTMSQATIDELLAAGPQAADSPANADATTPAVDGDGDEQASSEVRSRDSQIARILGLGVPVSVTLAQRPMSIESIIGITVGTILEFDAPSDGELSLEVADRTIGKGQAVKIGENFGLRINSIEDVQRRVGALRRP